MLFHVLPEIFLIFSQTVLLHSPGILSQPNDPLNLNLARAVGDPFDTQANILARFNPVWRLCVCAADCETASRALLGLVP